jgi:DNA modification methylase
LQLEVIRRALVLWSNPGDVVLSPFAGIGSEGYMALGGSTITGAAVEKPRKFIGVELKESYFRQATKNLMAAQSAKHSELFAACDQQESEAVA